MNKKQKTKTMQKTKVKTTKTMKTKMKVVWLRRLLKFGRRNLNEW